MKQKPILSVGHLSVNVSGKHVVKDLSLEIRPGEIHALMGPNGSGKSSFVQSLMGHPSYDVRSGTMTMLGKSLLKLTPDKRAALGLFLAFQYPRELAGVNLRSFLFAAANAQGKKYSPSAFRNLLDEEMAALHLDPSFAERSLNVGFSGGEKKKAEMLQMAILRPRLALLDETDSGLDIDALKIVGENVNRMRSPKFSALIVTHYARLLEVVAPDRVHVMVRGKIVESGGEELMRALEREGYRRYGVTEGGKLTLD